MKYPDPILRGQPVDLMPGMVCANNRNGQSGTADRLPKAMRDGAMDAYKLPSRWASELRYPDGRVETI